MHDEKRHCHSWPRVPSTHNGYHQQFKIRTFLFPSLLNHTGTSESSWDKMFFLTCIRRASWFKYRLWQHGTGVHFSFYSCMWQFGQRNLVEQLRRGVHWSTFKIFNKSFRIEALFNVGLGIINRKNAARVAGFVCSSVKSRIRISRQFRIRSKSEVLSNSVSFISPWRNFIEFALVSCGSSLTILIKDKIYI